MDFYEKSQQQAAWNRLLLIFFALRPMPYAYFTGT
jgi:hypothetical protein